MKPSGSSAQASRPRHCLASSGRPRVRGRPRPLPPAAPGARARRAGPRARQGQPTRAGPCGRGMEGQRFGRAATSIRHHRGQHRPASLRAVRAGLPQPGRSASGPGCPRRTPFAPAPSLPAGPPREGSQRAASRSTADSEDVGSARSQAEGCSQEVGGGPAPPNSLQVSA